MPQLILIGECFYDKQMASRKKRLTFDTSGINQLADDQASEVLIRGVGIAHEILITGNSVAEIVATKRSERRVRLLNVLRRFLNDGICVLPCQWLLERHAIAFLQTPKRYRWTEVPFRFPDLEREISDGKLFSDQTSEKVRNQERQWSKEFNQFYREERPAFEEIFDEGLKRPSFETFCQTALAQGEKPGWQIAIAMFEKATGKELSEQDIQQFLVVCPPFRAAFFSLLLAHFSKCISDPRGEELRDAGRTDLLSATFLPYCNIFVTDDIGQCTAFRKIAVEAHLSTEIVLYRDFTQPYLSLTS